MIVAHPVSIKSMVTSDALKRMRQVIEPDKVYFRERLALAADPAVRNEIQYLESVSAEIEDDLLPKLGREKNQASIRRVRLRVDDEVDADRKSVV